MSSKKPSEGLLKHLNGKPITVETQSCTECQSKNIMEDKERGEKVCLNCGFVVSDKLADRGPEWRAFDHEQKEKRKRVGSPLTYTVHDKGLSTNIGWRDKDIYGKKLSSEQKAQFYRMRKWQRRIRVSDATERNLAVALAGISKTGNKLTLPKNVLETASVIYRKAVKERLIRGRLIEGVTAAAIYVACRQCGIPRTLEEVAEASNISKKEVGRNYRLFLKNLDYSIPPIKTSKYITKISSQLDMQGKVEEISHKIFGTAKELKLTSGRGPASVAAATSYIASILTGEKKTQREIAEAADVTEVTIRNRYKELVERLYFVVKI